MANDIAAAFAAALEKIEQAAAEGLADAAELILDEAKRLCPEDTGALRASGKVAGGAAAMSAKIAFDAPHAVLVHERVELKHARGQSKFLEQAVANAARDGALDAIAERVRRAL